MLLDMYIVFSTKDCQGCAVTTHSDLSLQQLDSLPAVQEAINKTRLGQLQKEMLQHPNLTLASALGKCNCFIIVSSVCHHMLHAFCMIV